MFYKLTWRPFSWRSGYYPYPSQLFRGGDEIDDGVAITDKSGMDINHGDLQCKAVCRAK